MDRRFVSPLLGFAGTFASSFALCIAFLTQDAASALIATAAAVGCGTHFVTTLDVETLS